MALTYESFSIQNVSTKGPLTLRRINIHHGLNPSWNLSFLLVNKTFDYNLEKIKLKATKQNTQIAYKKDINILFHMRYIQREKMSISHDVLHIITTYLHLICNICFLYIQQLSKSNEVPTELAL